jgi:hypothetical protein
MAGNALRQTLSTGGNFEINHFAGSEVVHRNRSSLAGIDDFAIARLRPATASRAALRKCSANVCAHHRHHRGARGVSPDRRSDTAVMATTLVWTDGQPVPQHSTAQRVQQHDMSVVR